VLAYIHPSPHRFTVRLVLKILLPNLFRPYVPGWFPSNTAMCREPLCPKPGVTCFWHDVLHPVRWRYPSFIAHTGSCARPNSSRRLRINYYDRSLQVVASLCWPLARRAYGSERRWPFPIPQWRDNPCVGAWTPTPQYPSGALAHFFPKHNGLTSDVTRSAH